MFCTHKIVTVYDRSFIFPLYLYPKTKGQQSIGQFTERVPNLNQETVKQIAGMVGLTFTNEKETAKETFAPIDILDYIYAVLYSVTYREKYKEFIGGYQPAQKWLKDRKGRVLEFEDIQHYQKIIVALSESIRIMEEIDKIEFE
ncbi:MAG: hypothetical protein IPN55_02445 [Saprospiraceae bacterium]|nr:hypothetical protein [Candidatus Brachybacter algidus]